MVDKPKVGVGSEKLVSNRHFAGMVKETGTTSAPWKVSYKVDGVTHSTHFTSKKKAIAYTIQKFGIDPDIKTPKLLPDNDNVYTISDQNKAYEKYYGISSVPTIWQTQKVVLKDFPNEDIAVYRTKSGWLVSRVKESRLLDAAHKSKAGVSGYGFGTQEEAINAFIGQKLAKSISNKSETVDKEPWEMTNSEWNTAKWDARYVNLDLTLEEHSQRVKENARLDFGVYPYGNPLSMSHEDVIRKAIKEGKPIPTKILKDYPDLKVMVKGKAKLESKSEAEVSLQSIEDSRSNLSKSSDERQEHSLVIEPDDSRVKRWVQDPGSMDVRGIDTPRKSRVVNKKVKSKRRSSKGNPPSMGEIRR